MAASHVSQAEAASPRRRSQTREKKRLPALAREFRPPVAWRRTRCGPHSRGLRRSMSGAQPSPAEAGLQTRLVENQPYDESLDVNETEDVASIYAPSPPQPGTRPARAPCKDSSDEDEEGGAAALKGASTPPRAPGWAPIAAPDRPAGALLQPEKKGGGGPLGSGRRFSGHEVEDDDEDSSETDSDEDEDDEDDEHGAPLEGAYNSADYDYLPVSLEVKELFQYIRRYSSQMIDLEHKLKPFIPDFIPAVGDIDAFLKVPRPDGKPDNLGLLMLDEPSTKQSDPTVLSLWLTENSKQHNVAQVKVKSLENAEKNPKAVDSWIESISELHRCKPPATVHYARPMPDIDTLMQEWSPEFEELLGKVSLPTADVDCSLAEYTDMICAILDIPVYKGHIQPLHTLFSLYSEFKNSQHFKALAEGKKVASPPSNPPSQAGETDILSFT
ncbi:intraflagellar transport protein 46 homolog isoform X2 [Ahaetulla prasina]|uniref:intraflagellar transport protein 46 homolog isoform X2 n=1 Tax=Ahaetulla prasina TaxID=499056 RepID=UPI002649EA1F|nr:intraflagellar transport protein 46 homolog isoform X2 [Ahaetulla prasina]